ncbi:MAG: immunoglobulin-like domain-containing protein, partial [Anaerorhabdus sp.]
TGVSVSDTEDSLDLSDVVANPTSVDTSVAGFVTVTYTVEDSDGNEVSAKQVVLVNDGSYVVGDDYVLYAEDFTVIPTEVDNSKDGILEDSNAAVYDKEGNELTIGTDVDVNVNPGTYSRLPGDHEIIISVVGDDKASKEIIANVTKGESAVITVNPVAVAIDLGTTYDLTDIMSGVSATDVEDGVVAVTSDITSVDSSVAGVTFITYTAEDSDGNITNANRVVVVDGDVAAEKDYIIAAVNFERYQSEVTGTDEEIKTNSQLVVYKKNAEGTYDSVSNDVVIAGPGYANYQTATVGVNTIVMAVKAQTTTQVQIDATVKMNLSIEIQVENPFVELALGETVDLLEGVTVVDQLGNDVTGDTTLRVANDGGLDVNKTGTYIISYAAEKGTLAATPKIKVIVVNGSVFYGSKYVIVAHDFTKTIDQVRAEGTENSVIIDASGMLVFDIVTADLVENGAKKIAIDNGGYTAKLGEYTITFSIIDDVVAGATVVASVEEEVFPSIKHPGVVLIPEGSDDYDLLEGVTVKPQGDGDGNDYEVEVINSIDTDIPGLQVVEYALVDKDGKFAEEAVQRVVVINDGSYVTSDGYILHAEDFNVHSSEVVLTAESVLDLANVEVSRYSSNELNTLSPLTNVTTTLGSYNATEGTYEIKFTLKNGASITVDAIVSANNHKPTLTHPGFTEVQVGESIDLLEGVVATDIEDGNLSIESSANAIDTTVPGIYRITYKTTDSDGVSASAVRVILVNNGEYGVGNSTIIRADDYTIASEFVKVKKPAIAVRSMFRSFSKETGLQLCVLAEKYNVDFGTYSKTVGEYTLSTSLQADPAASTTFVATVVADPSIGIVLDESIVNIDIGDQYDLFTGVSVVDQKGNDVTDQANLQIAGYGGWNANEKGIYRISYIATYEGLSANPVTRLVVVGGGIVRGQNYIVAALDFTIDLGEEATDEEILDLVANANVTVFDAETFDEVELSEKIIVEDGGYGAQVGVYTATFTVEGEDMQPVAIVAEVVETTDEEVVITEPEDKDDTEITTEEDEKADYYKELQERLDISDELMKELIKFLEDNNLNFFKK